MEIKGEPVDKVNEAIKLLRQDMTFEAEAIMALAHIAKTKYENDALWRLIIEEQLIRAADGLPTDAVLAVFDKMGRNSR